MNTEFEQVDVLVVGAGPTGLMAALQLAAAGVNVRIIDEARSRATQSRALAVQSRSLELLRPFGVVDELLALGNRALTLCAFVEGRRAVSWPLSDLGVPDAPYPFVLFVSQAEVERVLDEKLRAAGRSVERGTKFVSASESVDGVHVRLGRSDGVELRLNARYVIGCDGAHSAVRQAANLTFRGARYPQDFVLADVMVDWDGPHDELLIYLSSGGLLAVFPFREAGLFRLVAAGPDDVTEVHEPTLEEVQRIADRLSPRRMSLRDPRWLARFRLHHRGVDRYRRGRLFVAGDAAHIHSPAGGQGMNTGLQDAANLAWKLVLALREGAPAALLDSYDEERRPVGRRLLRFTDRLFQVAASPYASVRFVRDLTVRYVFPRLFAGPRGHAQALRFVSQLAIKYPSSPIVREPASGMDSVFRRGPRAGDRAPDARVRTSGSVDASLFDLFDGVTHQALVFGGPASSDPRPFLEAMSAFRGARWLRSHAIVGRAEGSPLPDGALVDPTGELHQRYGLRGPGLYVIRPDGYVGTRSPAVNAADVREYARILGIRADGPSAAEGAGAPLESLGRVFG